MEIPYVGYNKNAGAYSLYGCELTEKQWKKVRRKKSEISAENLRKLAITILSEHGIKESTYYPVVTLSKTGELSAVNIGSDCACITKSDKGYAFHNIKTPREALAGLEIIVKYLDYTLN